MANPRISIFSKKVIRTNAKNSPDVGPFVASLILFCLFKFKVIAIIVIVFYSYKFYSHSSPLHFATAQSLWPIVDREGWWFEHSGFLYSKDGVVWLWHLILYIYIYIYIIYKDIKKRNYLCQKKQKDERLKVESLIWDIWVAICFSQNCAIWVLRFRSRLTKYIALHQKGPTMLYEYVKMIYKIICNLVK